MDELLHVRAKVERGEPLEPRELEALERAAASSEGPSLRLAVAQALLNASAEREALRLLESLSRDFPRDLQTHLGHARALAGLERYADAEQALGRALALSPEDPEALKALAVLALRRGERGRAMALAATVLRIDPFDGEARLIKEELEAGEVDAPPDDAGAVEMAAAVGGALRRRRVRHLIRNGEVLLVVKGELRRAPLPRRLEAPFQEAADRFVGRLLDLPALSTGAEALLSSVLPVLREPRFAERARGAACREGPAGLMVFYVLEHPELLRYVPRAAAEAAGVSLEALDLAAFERLSAGPVEPRRLTGNGLWMLASADGHDAARLLTPAQRERLRASVGEGPWRVDLGRREAAFVCREADGEAVRALEQLPAEEDGLAGRYRLTGDGLKRLG